MCIWIVGERVPVTGMLAGMNLSKLGMNLSKTGMNLSKPGKKHNNHVKIQQWGGVSSKISIFSTICLEFSWFKTVRKTPDHPHVLCHYNFLCYYQHVDICNIISIVFCKQHNHKSYCMFPLDLILKPRINAFVTQRYTIPAYQGSFDIVNIINDTPPR